MMTANDRVLVLLSGGQDSTVCLFWALNRFKYVEAVCFRYGQRHETEIEAAQAIASKAHVPFRVIDASMIGRLSNNSLTDLSIEMDQKPGDAIPNTFVPGRNLLFLSFAAVIARENHIRHFVTGVSQTDFSGYPDCRDTFIRSLNVTINLAMKEQFVILTPLMWLDKKRIWQLADELGVFDLVKQQTVTCYKGIPAEGCGECPACRLRKHGLEQYEKDSQ